MKQLSVKIYFSSIVCLMFLAGCSQMYHIATTTPAANEINTQSTTDNISENLPSQTSQSLPLSTPIQTSLPTSKSVLSLTKDPSFELTIDHLVGREYGGGEIEIMDVLSDDVFFTKYIIRYQSDGLWIYGFVNIPKGEGPLPVIVVIHGYIDPEIYTTIDYTTRYADDLARRGFVVFHPNLRNYPPSDDGENLFRVGMAIDILNLINIIQNQVQASGINLKIDGDQIGLWGHSMGGGIATRVMTVNQEIKAVVLYAAMSGDELKNFKAINIWSDGERGNDELNFPVAKLDEISPEYHLDQITAAVSIHHGLADELVPAEWSTKTCELLKALKKDVECNYYSEMPHTFWGRGDQEFMDNVAKFFTYYLYTAGE